MYKNILRLMYLFVMVGFVASCGGGGSDNDQVPEIIEEVTATPVNETATSKFIGTWLIQKEDSSSYWIFFADGVFAKKRAGRPADSANHFLGTFSVKDGVLTGNFSNPGVGTGKIEGTIGADGKFLMNFIEFWHNPPKVVPCVGVKQ